MGYYDARTKSGETLSPAELRDIQTDLNAMPNAVRDELDQHSAPLAATASNGSGLSGRFGLAASEIDRIMLQVPPGPAPMGASPSSPRP